MPVLKLVSIFLQGVFGILALLVEFKKPKIPRPEDEKAVTGWGWFSLVGVLASMTMTASIQISEDRSKASTTEEEFNRLSRVYSGLERAVNPLSDIHLTYIVELPLVDQRLQPLLARMEEISANLSDPSTEKHVAHAYIFAKRPGSASIVRLRAESDAIGDDKWEWALLHHVGAGVRSFSSSDAGGSPALS